MTVRERDSSQILVSKEKSVSICLLKSLGKLGRGPVAKRSFVVIFVHLKLDLRIQFKFPSF